MVGVSVGNIEQLQGMPDVEFDFGVSEALRAAFSAAATQLSGQRGSRSGYRCDGLTDFEGHFAEVFRGNGVVQLSDLDEIVDNLRSVDARVAELEDAARAENRRRQQAREWAERMANRNGFQEFWDGLFGSEQPPVSSLDEAGPSESVAAAPASNRQTPESGSGGGGGGVSSARPEHLSLFATNTNDADDVLAAKPGVLEDHCSQFAALCKWATLDASSVITGYRQWLTANGRDAEWASAVGAAFATASGQGSICSLPDSAISAALAAQGLSEGRSDIQMDPPTGFGSPPTTGYSDDPVNTGTGNFIENEIDLSFTGGCSALVFPRSYSSLNPAAGGFGLGWSSWTDSRLDLGADSARLRLPDGRVVVFPREGAGWGRAPADNLLLEPDQGRNQLVVSSPDGLRWEFTATGQLLSASTGEGTRLDFSHDPAGRLTRITHEFDRWIDLIWDQGTGLDAGRVAGLVGSDGRQVDYSYDDHGRLAGVSGPGVGRSYSRNQEGLIESVADADGVIEVRNLYDTTGRVTEQTSAFGRVSKYAYLPGGVTVVSDSDGRRANTWIADRRGRLVGVIDADDRRQSMSYDRWGNLVMATERDGATTITQYDEQGRKRLQALPSGARLGWVYDQTGRLTQASVTNPDNSDGEPARTLFTYDGDSRNPSTLVDPAGGVTRMSWDRGLLVEVVDPTGVRVRFGYDQHGDLVSSTDADGNTAHLERDQTGRVTAAITPLGYRTKYRYGPDGLLKQRVDPDGAVWAYEHTPAGKLQTTIDPMGGRTHIDYGDHGEREQVTDPLGRVVVTSYDDLGNLARVELPDGQAWQFGYDPSSRLRNMTDAAGGQWAWAYDPNGQVTGITDPTGVQRHIQHNPAGLPTRLVDGDDTTTATYDQLGRLVSQAGADGESTEHRYDLCGRLIQTTNPDGGITRYQRDPAGRVISVTQPLGGTFSYEYDQCGRWVATISTGGDRYEMHYDADGRVMGETWPTGEQVATTFDACGRITQRDEPGRGTTRFGYDKCGRITWVRDPWYGHRKFRYDPAGQLVAAVNALGATTRYEYDTAGRQTAVIDPLGLRQVL